MSVQHVQPTPPHRTYDMIIKFILIGDCNVGKSALMMRWAHNIFPSIYVPTVMVDFKIKSELVQSNNKSVKAQVFEASGATQYQNNVAYYRGASVAVFVFDLTNRDSFEHIATWNEKFELERPGIVKMLVGTKSGSVSRTVGKDEALELARQLGMTYWDVDSETSFQVDQMFLDAIDQRIKMDRELEESGVVVGKLPTSQFLILKTSHPHTWTEWIKSWWGN